MTSEGIVELIAIILSMTVLGVWVGIAIGRKGNDDPDS